jgi:hypothetical protein
MPLTWRTDKSSAEQRQAAANQTIEVLQAEQGRLASEIEQIQKQRRIADTPTLDSTEQAKRQQLDGTANKIEETSAERGWPLHRLCRPRRQCPTIRYSPNRC